MTTEPALLPPLSPTPLSSTPLSPTPLSPAAARPLSGGLFARALPVLVRPGSPESAFGADGPFRVAGGPESPEGQRLLGDRLARVVLGDVLVAYGAPDSQALRAAAAALLLPPGPGRRAVGFGAAAWLYAGAGAVGGPPARLDVVIEPGRRRPSSPWLRVRQVPLPSSAVGALLGVPVTTPVRTAADVARDLPAEAALRALRRLAELTEVRPHQVLAELAGMRYARGAANARRVVRAWSEEP